MLIFKGLVSALKKVIGLDPAGGYDQYLPPPVGPRGENDWRATLDNLIIFKSLDLETDASLWAHELTHVSQYDGMGIDGFAYAYTVDPMNLEGQA